MSLGLTPAASADRLRTIAESIPGCLACAYLDLAEGLLHGAQNGEGAGPELATLCAAAAQDLLETGSVHALETLYKRDGSGGGSRPHEVILFSTEHLYVLEWAPGAPPRALVAVCGATAELSDVIGRLRAALAALDADPP